MAKKLTLFVHVNSGHTIKFESFSTKKCRRLHWKTPLQRTSFNHNPEAYRLTCLNH